MTIQEEQEAELLKQGEDAENLPNFPSFKSEIKSLAETSFQTLVSTNLSVIRLSTAEFTRF